MFLLTYAWSNMAGALEALAHSGGSEHLTHELHDAAHVSEWGNDDQRHDEQLENNAHHHCAHSLVGMAFEPPTAHRADAITLISAGSPSPHYFRLQQRLLRPPRN